MIKGDKIENYIFIRHKLFRITREAPLKEGIELAEWKKSTFQDDFGKSDLVKVKIVRDPKQLDIELQLPYIQYLEGKVYNWKQLME